MGYAVLQIWVLRRLLHSYHETYERQQYLALGSLFVAVIWVTERWLCPRGRWPRAARLMRLGCVGALAVALWLTLSAWIFAVGVRASRGIIGMAMWPGAWVARAGRLLASACAMLVACGLFGTFFWWVKLPIFITHPHDMLWAGGVGLTCAGTLSTPGRLRAPTKILHALDACMLAGLFVWSWRASDIPPYHYGFVVGPAELLHDGGHLLWDIPAQYGFMNTLLIAYGPTASPWFNLYAINAALTCVMVAILYLGLVRSQATWRIRLVAAAITAASVLLLPGDPATLSGPQSVPTSGAFRFVWLFVLVAIAAYGTDGWQGVAYSEQTQRKRARRALWAGSAVWVASLFWSLEVGGWSTLTWWPAAVCLAMRERDVTGTPSTIRALLNVCASLTTTAGLALLLTSGVYAWCTGHAPDWTMYLDFARAYGTGYASLDMHPRGSVWALLALYTLAVWVCVQAGMRLGWKRLPPVLVAATTAFWAGCSYFVSRSHESNATCLMPLVALLGMVLLRFVSVPALPNRVRSALPLYVVPLFAVIVGITYHSPNGLVHVAQNLFVGVEGLRQGSPALPDPLLESLLAVAPIDCDDALSYAGAEQPGHMPPTVCRDRLTQTCRVQRHYRQWLPIHPAAALLALPEHRRVTYLDRYLQRHNNHEGWLIDHKLTTLTQDRWIATFVDQRFEVAETYENEVFRARRYRLRDAS